MKLIETWTVSTDEEFFHKRAATEDKGTKWKLIFNSNWYLVTNKHVKPKIKLIHLKYKFDYSIMNIFGDEHWSDKYE